MTAALLTNGFTVGSFSFMQAGTAIALLLACTLLQQACNMASLLLLRQLLAESGSKVSFQSRSHAPARIVQLLS